MRSRAKLTNLHEKTYALDDVSLAFPIPAEATELLDFAGSHNCEWVPQRGTLRTGTHLRETERAGPALTVPSYCTPELLDSDSAMAKSGPSTRHGAETTTISPNAFSAISCSAAENCSFPAKSGWASVIPIRAPGFTPPTGQALTPSPNVSMPMCGAAFFRSPQIAP